MRADTSKTTIKRKYQKVMEFYADSSSLLIALFDVLYIVFYFFNRFYAYHSLSKQIFFFKEVENHNFYINRKYNQTKNLIKILNPFVEKKIIPLSINDNKSQTSGINDDINDIDINGLEKGINIYNKNKKIRNQGCLSKIDEIYKPDDVRKFVNRKMKNKLNKKIKFSKDKDIDENNRNLSTLQSTKRNVINKYKIRQFITPKKPFKGAKEIDYKKIGRITFNYNILEILWFYLGTCCMSNRLKSKSILTKKSNNILNDKLDISLYIKNTILIDILSQALINDNMKSMTKFISRPIISLYKSSEMDMSQFYKNYELTDFNNLYEDVSEMPKKLRLTQAEQKIISLVYSKLKEMI